MKYGRYLRDSVPQRWHDDVLNYWMLKKIIKRISESSTITQKIEGEEENMPLSGEVPEHAAQEFVDMLLAERDRVREFLNSCAEERREKLQELELTLEKYHEMSASKRKDLERKFIRFYEEIDELRDFKILNILAIYKIIKKFRKEYPHSFEDEIQQAMDEGDFNRIDSELRDIQSAAEKRFASTFEQNNFRDTLNKLRTFSKKRSHWSSFVIGIPFGASVALSLVLVAMLYNPGMDIEDVQNYFHHFYVFRMVGLFLIAITFWAGNIFVWKRNRINYVYILQFDYRNTMTYWKVLQVALILWTVYLSCLCGYVGLSKDIFFPGISFLAPVFPLLLLAFLLAFLLSPFNIFGTRSARMYWVKIFKEILIIPFRPVSFGSFFLCDLMTSYVKPLSDIPAIACYYASGELIFEENYGSCEYINLATHFFFTILPYWLRFVQCLRKFYDTRDVHPHLVNSGKYTSCCVYIILAHIMTLMDMFDAPKVLIYIINGMWLVTLCIATAYTFLWDVTVDWGLMRPNLKRPFLRKDLAYTGMHYYYIAIVLDFFMRLCWVITVTPFTREFNTNYMIFFTAAVEIFRRSVWGFFRLEYEYVNDVDGFRSKNYIPGAKGIEAVLNEQL